MTHSETFRTALRAARIASKHALTLKRWGDDKDAKRTWMRAYSYLDMARYYRDIANERATQ